MCSILFFPFMSFYGEMLWFYSLGFSQRFWTVIAAQVGFMILFAVISWCLVYLLTWFIPSKQNQIQRILSQILALVIGGSWGYQNWDTILKFFYSTPTEIRDPILEQRTSFYLFHLPFYDSLYSLLITVSVIALLVSVATMLIRIQYKENELVVVEPDEKTTNSQRIEKSFYLSAAVVLLLLGWGQFLDRYHLLYSQWGVTTGAGWTDVHIRLPGYWIVFFCLIGSAIALMIPPVRGWLQHRFLLSATQERNIPFYSVGVVILPNAIIWFLALTVVPSAFQWLRVEPNEISVETPYIRHNIQYTRQGFHLDKVEEKKFPASEQFTQEIVNRNQNLFQNIRLWDYRALDAVYKQFQEIRLYYEFQDVDIDRYTFQDEYREVMVSARELELANLPEQSQTFINRRFKYTHGYGITLTTVSEFTPQGLPNLLVKDIPPKSKYPELEVKQPEIYYGGLTDSYVIVNTQEQEFDYPSGEKNIYTRYQGSGGVEISNLWRKFVYGWKYGGTRLFFSGYPTRESRIQFHRQIRDRVNTVAPFLEFDDDPYIVLVDGKLYWMLDGYTVSEYYPYSEPFSSMEQIEYRNGQSHRLLTSLVDAELHGANYIRNSVKMVVNAYNGNLTFYVYEPDDPIIQVWQRIFPNLFKTKEDMPAEFKQHVRYPSDMLLVQGLIYAKYHMEDPTVFYNQEDLWVRATEKYYNQVQPVEPYYIMWEPPSSNKTEFILIQPFTPKNRQVLIGWIAGMCDPENYGRFIAYQFPKEKRILGPQQVETKIDQDSFLSGQLTLWDQRGSNVIRGNVLAIPIEETLLYVEPIYLQAETAAYPELRLVVLMHNDQLSYAETFDDALQNLLQEKKGKLPEGEKLVGEQTVKQMIQQANNAFDTYLQQMGEKNFNRANEALQDLQNNLEQLMQQTRSSSSSSSPSND